MDDDEEHTSADPQRKNMSARVEEEVRKSSGPRAIASWISVKSGSRIYSLFLSCNSVSVVPGLVLRRMETAYWEQCNHPGDGKRCGMGA